MFVGPNPTQFNHPTFQPTDLENYEALIKKLEQQIQDLANPSLFRKITQKLLELAQGEAGITQGIAGRLSAYFLKDIIALFEELDQKIQDLAKQNLPSLERRIREDFRRLAEIQVKTWPDNSTPQLFFINPEPLTKKGIQESNRQICLIYTGKRGNIPDYVPCGMKRVGSALGTVFAKTPSQSGKTAKKWLGKVGMPKGNLRNDADTYTTRTKKELNADTIREKLAYDLYEELGRGLFKLPKTRLSEQDLRNKFMPQEMPYAQHVIVHGDDKKFTTSLRIMSRYIEGYHDFGDGWTLDERTETSISFLDFMRIYRRPPDCLLTPNGTAVPLHGFMEMIAVGRMLADTDSFGISGRNAGFIWVREKGRIVRAETVKIDPGMAFTFTEDDNWVINTWKQIDYLDQLKDPKDFQIAYLKSDRLPLSWTTLTEKQQESFLSVLFNASRYLKSSDVLKYLFYRDKGFYQSDIAQLPENEAQELQNELSKWITFQLEIYKEELKIFHQKHPEQALRAYYIDACGELSLPMTGETLPIRDLFTELVIVDWKEKKGDQIKHQKILSAYLSETDSSTGTTDSTEFIANTAALEKLFDGKKKITLSGRAGIGKSTLCQKMAHDWASGRLWNDRFDAVYWLSLRDLNGLEIGDDPECFLADVALPHLFRDVVTLKELCKGLHDKRVLFILDGYDEASSVLAQVVEKLMNKSSFHILLVSRSGDIGGIEVDQIVESIGFADKHIETYIDKFCKRRDDLTQKKKGSSLFAMIQKNPNLYPMARIPLQLQVMGFLLENDKSRISRTTYKDWTLLHVAASGGHVGAMKFLLGHDKGLISKCTKNKVTPLHAAAYGGHVEAMRFLLEQDKTLISAHTKASRILGSSDASWHPLGDWNSFHCAAYGGHIEAMKFLLEQDKTLISEYMQVDVFNSYTYGDHIKEEMAFFLDWQDPKSTELTFKSRMAFKYNCMNCFLGDSTPLHIAAQGGHVEALKFLLRQDEFSLFSYHKIDYTPLHSAARGGHVEAMKFLLEKNKTLLAKPSPVTFWTPLHHAAIRGHVEAMQYLLEQDKTLISTVYAGKKYGDSILSAAAYGGYVKAGKFIFEIAPKLLNQPNRYGKTPLVVAKEHYSKRFAEWLISVGGKEEAETCNIM